MRTTAITLLSSLLPLLLLFLGESTATGPSFLRRLGGALNDIVRDDDVVLHDDPLPRLRNAIRKYHADRDLPTTPLLTKRVSMRIPSKYNYDDADRDFYWGLPTEEAVINRVFTDVSELGNKEANSRLKLEIEFYVVALNRDGDFTPEKQHKVGQELRELEVKHPVPDGTDRASIKVRSPSLALALDAVDNINIRLNALVEGYSPALRDKVAGDLIWLNKIADQSIQETTEWLPIVKRYLSQRTATLRAEDLIAVRESYAKASMDAQKILEASSRAKLGFGETF